MKIAIFSDIHGNLEALNAVVKDIKSIPDLDHIVCLGDIVGYYPHPNECIEIVREMCDIIIKGNHDASVVARNFDKVLNKFNDIAARSLTWTRDKILETNNTENYDFLRKLPKQKEITIGRKKILFVHGTPDKTWEYFLYPYWLNAPLEEQKVRIDEWLQQWDVIAMGHSHWAFQYEDNNKIVINPGSVGQPRDDNPKASYALVEVTKTRIKALNFRIEYDIKKTCEAVQKANLDESLCDRITDGH